MKPPTYNKERYYQQAAKRFMLDARLLRCRAAVHVEDRDDVFFWSNIFTHFRPQDRFHFIAGSRNERGNETKGVTQCLKYLHHLNSKFFICIDSDYRYLLQEQWMNVKHFVFQTYTYSFENHHCYGQGLNNICKQVTGLPNKIFDFTSFIKKYSEIVYELFLWHLYFLEEAPRHSPVSEFYQLISLNWSNKKPDISNNAYIPLQSLRKKVNFKLKHLHKKYPQVDINPIQIKFTALGLTPETTYFFLRGHNMYDMIYALSKEVCKKVLRDARAYYYGPRQKVNLFGYRNSIELQLKQNLQFGAYSAIQKIEQDIQLFFN